MLSYFFTYRSLHLEHLLENGFCSKPIVLNFIAVSYHEIVVPNVYAQYRVFLAVLEAKLENLKTAYPLPARDTDLVYNYQVNADLLRVAQTVTIAPEPIKRLINAVGIVSHDEGVYIPAVSRVETDDRGRFIQSGAILAPLSINDR